MTIATMLRQWWDSDDRPAMTYLDRFLTRKEMIDRASRSAGFLADRGVEPGDVIAYIGENHPVYFDLLFASACLPATLAAINWRLAPGEVDALLADAAPRAVVASSEHRRLVGSAFHDRMLVFDPTVERDPWGRAEGRPVMPSGSLDDPRLLLYTSGTTGSQKGVAFSERQLAGNTANMVDAYLYDSSSMSLVTLPVFHLGGGVHALTAFRGGGQVVLAESYDVGDVVAQLELGVTHLPAVPTQVQDLIDHGPIRSASLRYVIYGGAAMDPGLLRRATAAFGCGFVGSYGSTETGTLTALSPTDHARALAGDEYLLASVGQVLPSHEVILVPTVPETGEGPGEIAVRGPLVMTGYWPEEGRGLDADGWFRTGDVGRLDGEGYLYVVGRLKDVVISGGENISASEVEAALRGHPLVLDAAVVGAPDSRWGEVVVAFIESRPEARPSTSELRVYLEQEIARYKIPKAFRFMDRLPRNALGKVAKRHLSVLLSQGGSPGAS